MQNTVQQATEIAQESASNQSLIILITGFVVVFLVLLLLIGIIKIYSGIVYSIQKKAASKAKAQESVSNTEDSLQTVDVIEEVDSDSPDLQTIAVISAAVEAIYGDSNKVRITGIRPTSSARSEWAQAGLRDNIPSMRTEGLF